MCTSTSKIFSFCTNLPYPKTSNTLIENRDTNLGDLIPTSSLKSKTKATFQVLFRGNFYRESFKIIYIKILYYFIKIKQECIFICIYMYKLISYISILCIYLYMAYDTELYI